MKITVKILKETNDATLSAIYLDDEFQCFGLEDEQRDVKVAGETRIPRGLYNIGVRDVGGFHNRYTKKFEGHGDFHKGMLQVLNVPNFEYILIHIGNTDENTAGCLLVGVGADSDNMTISKSKVAYIEFYEKVIDEAINGNVTIEYIDSDVL